MTRRGLVKPLDLEETAQLAELLGRGLPPHHALYRTNRTWYVYRWDEVGGRFKPYLDAPSLAALLERLQRV